MIKDDVLKILESGNLQAFIGISENEWFECKQAPYHLKNPKQKQELAKDVVALANSAGGVILLGVKTEKNETHHGDEVKEICPFGQDLIDVNDYYNVLKHWIYPNLHNVQIKWYQSADQPSKGITVISIPEQPTSSAPYLLTQIFDDNDKLTEIVFGYSERKRAEVESINVSMLHNLIKNGLRFDSINNRLDALEDILQEILKSGLEASGQSLKEKQDTISQRIYDDLQEGNFFGLPYIAFAIAPQTGIDITSIFEGRGSDIVKLLDDPPTIRSSGFHLRTGKISKIVKGKARRSLDSGYILLELWRDGNLIFIGTGGKDLLSWGRYYDEKETLKINDYALIEMAYLFCELGKRVFSSIEPTPQSFIARLELRNMSSGDKPCRILATQRMTHLIKEAPSDGENFEFNIGNEFYDTGSAAFMFVSKVYEWFGVDYDRIPLIGNADGKFFIDSEQIIALDRNYT